MRRLVAIAAGVAALSACEVLVGIKDKTVADGGADASADPSAPCAQQPAGYLFCDDFDEDQAEAGTTWQWDQPVGGASIGLSSAQYSTAPRSVEVTVPANQSAYAQLGSPDSEISSNVRLAFDLYLDEDDLSSLPEVGVVQLLAGTAKLSINYLLGAGDQAQLQVYDTSSQATVVGQKLPAPPLRTWTRIVVAYDASQGVSVIEDGTTLASSAAAARGAPGTTGIIVGAVYVNLPGSTPYHAYVDTVVLRGQ